MAAPLLIEALVCISLHFIYFICAFRGYWPILTENTAINLHAVTVVTPIAQVLRQQKLDKRGKKEIKSAIPFPWWPMRCTRCHL